MRSVSTTALQAFLDQHTDEVILTCVKISHPDLVSDLKFVNDNQDLVRSDGTYVASAFQFRLPSDEEDNIPKGQIVLDNVDLSIIQSIRPLETPPEVTVSLVLASSPNTVEVGPMAFSLKKMQYDAQKITGTLSYDEDFLNSGYPKNVFNPRTTPGIF